LSSSTSNRTPPAPRPRDITVVLPVTSPHAELDQVVASLSEQFTRMGKDWEFALVFDGVRGDAWRKAEELRGRLGDRILTIAFEKPFGESVCLSAGAEISGGRVLVTSPQYVQIDPVEVRRMLEQIETGADMVAPWRNPRVDPWLNRLQSASFNWLMRKINGGQFHDLNCYLRVFKREVLADVSVYGDMYRFLPLIAQRQGFRVVETQVRHLKEWGKAGFFGVGVYIRRFLDVLGVVFLTRFTLKPLRFFGSVGLVLTVFGGGLLAGVIYQKFAFGEGLYNRPLFLLALMLFVLGVQVIGFGLVGEIIIYTQARNLREYRIERAWDDDSGDGERS